MEKFSCIIEYYQTSKTLSEVFLSTLAACSSRRKSPLSDVRTLLFQENMLAAWRRASERGVSFICIQFHGETLKALRVLGVTVGRCVCPNNDE